MERYKDIVNQLNNTLENNNVWSVNEFTNIIIMLICSNISKNDTLRLIDKINALPISKWNK